MNLRIEEWSGSVVANGFSWLELRVGWGVRRRWDSGGRSRCKGPEENGVAVDDGRPDRRASGDRPG